MIKKFALCAVALAVLSGSALAPFASAQAQQFDGPRDYRDRGRGDWRPPERHDRHHHHGNGGIIAGGIAAGVVGGLIGGALANGGAPRTYYEPPPPPRPRCWFEDRQVANAYDGGWHMESVRVCR